MVASIWPILASIALGSLGTLGVQLLLRRAARKERIEEVRKAWLHQLRWLSNRLTDVDQAALQEGKWDPKFILLSSMHLTYGRLASERENLHLIEPAGEDMPVSDFYSALEIYVVPPQEDHPLNARLVEDRLPLVHQYMTDRVQEALRALSTAAEAL